MRTTPFPPGSRLGYILSQSRSGLGLGAAPALDWSVRPELVAYPLPWHWVICPGACGQASGSRIVGIVLLYFGQYVAVVVFAGAARCHRAWLDYLGVRYPGGVLRSQLLLCPCPCCPIIEGYFKHCLRGGYSSFCLVHRRPSCCRAWWVQVNGCACCGGIGVHLGQ